MEANLQDADSNFKQSKSVIHTNTLTCCILKLYNNNKVRVKF